MRGRMHLATCLCLLASIAAAPAAAENPACGLPGQLVAPPPGSGKPLQQPDEFCSKGVKYCPGGNRSLAGQNGIRPTLEMRYFKAVPVGSQTLDLRMYGYPLAGKTKFTLPAPTYRVRIGETIDLTYRNCLAGTPPSENHKCNPRSNNLDTFPNCFHADDVTNFHFHGFHISPGPKHDDVFLKLYPGEPDYAITSGPIPVNQAPGTHWYHPHNHGSTSLQLLNGMAGAFLVEGPFDDALHDHFKQYGGLREQVMFIQDIGGALRFPPQSGPQPQELLVNGQKSPQVDINELEIQRWRFIGGTMRSIDNITVRFPQGYEVRQIAMDGIQFHPDNYETQPLLQGGAFRLAPGNRADFLVKAPKKPKELDGRHGVLYQVNTPASVDAEIRTLVEKAATAPLFSIVISERPGPAEGAEGAAPAEAVDMQFPKTLPDLPPFLDDIEPEEVEYKRTVVFSMSGERNNPDPAKVPRFFIDGKKFDHGCVDQRMKLDAVEEWQIVNRGPSPTVIQHPAHIHVNPFQVVARDGKLLPPPWIWQDTIALPPWNGNVDGSVAIRHRFEDFPGKYVMHCHILGHEDRGMMQLLEVGGASGLPLCKDKPPTAGEDGGHSHGGH